MAHPFAREPVDGWSVGDRAYCIREVRGLLKKGAIYTVETVIPLEGIAHSGLTLGEVSAPPPSVGFLSHRFVCLKEPLRSIPQITAGTKHRFWEDLTWRKTTPARDEGRG